MKTEKEIKNRIKEIEDEINFLKKQLNKNKLFSIEIANISILKA